MGSNSGIAPLTFVNGSPVKGADELRPLLHRGPEIAHPERARSTVSVEAPMTIATDTPARDFDHPETDHTLLWSGARGAEPEDADAPDSSGELLQTIADVLDIRSVFPRVSEIANKMLPHDALILNFVDQDGQLVRQAVSTEDIPSPTRLVTLTTGRRDAFIIQDLRTDAFPTTEP